MKMISPKKFFLVFWVSLVVQIVWPCCGFSTAPDIPELGFYRQTVLIRFKTPEAAQKARVTVTGLYHDLDAAFSSRWDDNNLNDLTVARLLRARNMRGTFYLNASSAWAAPNALGLALAGDPATALPKALLAGGNSIGDHTLNHEYLPWLSRNRAFEEILGGRIDREVASQSPLSAFTYPFVSFKNPLSGEPGPEELEELILRSGLYFLGEDEGWIPEGRLLASRFVSLDGSPQNGLEVSVERRRRRRGADRPLYLATMHAWPDAWGGPGLPRLEALLDAWGGVGRWWYCNQNQYAAYRAQALKTHISTSVEGNVLTLSVSRPDPLDLGDLTPLSFLLEDVASGDAESVVCEGAPTKPFGGNGVYGFDLFHDNGRGLPKIYSKTDNPGNEEDVDAAPVPDDLAGLHVRLYRRDGKLVLKVKNKGWRILHDMRVVFRAGPRWEDGVTARPAGGLAPGGDKTLAITVKPRGTESGAAQDPRDLRGEEFDAAQVDFLFGEVRARLYATCRVPEEKPDPAFARDGFLALGPLPSDRKDFDFERFTWAILKGARIKGGYKLFEGVTVSWRAWSARDTQGFNPNLVLTTGKPAGENFYTWDKTVFYPYGKVLSYLLVGRVYSPSDRKVELVTPPVGVGSWSVNGDLEADRGAVLRKGWNDLRLLYGADPSGGTGFDPAHYGAYVRFNDGDGQPVTDLRFERPKEP